MNQFSDLFYTLSVQAQIAVGLALIVFLLFLIFLKLYSPGRKH